MVTLTLCSLLKESSVVVLYAQLGKQKKSVVLFYLSLLTWAICLVCEALQYK